jgi:hypothetical protein
VAPFSDTIVSLTFFETSNSYSLHLQDSPSWFLLVRLNRDPFPLYRALR